MRYLWKSAGTSIHVALGMFWGYFLLFLRRPQDFLEIPWWCPEDIPSTFVCCLGGSTQDRTVSWESPMGCPWEPVATWFLVSSGKFLECFPLSLGCPRAFLDIRGGHLEDIPGTSFCCLSSSSEMYKSLYLCLGGLVSFSSKPNLLCNSHTAR